MKANQTLRESITSQVNDSLTRLVKAGKIRVVYDPERQDYIFLPADKTVNKKDSSK